MSIVSFPNKNNENCRLYDISTQWTQIENLLETMGPQVVVEYLDCRYRESFTAQLKRYRPQYDDSQIEDIATEVLLQFIREDYKKIKKLDRNKKLRGLFFRILKSQLREYERREQKHKNIAINEMELESNFNDNANAIIRIRVDIEAAFDKIDEKLGTELKFAEIARWRYCEGNSIPEIQEKIQLREGKTLGEGAIIHRLKKVRNFLERTLREYQTND